MLLTFFHLLVPIAQMAKPSPKEPMNHSRKNSFFTFK